MSPSWATRGAGRAPNQAGDSVANDPADRRGNQKPPALCLNHLPESLRRGPVPGRTDCHRPKGKRKPSKRRPYNALPLTRRRSPWPQRPSGSAAGLASVGRRRCQRQILRRMIPAFGGRRLTTATSILAPYTQGENSGPIPELLERKETGRRPDSLLASGAFQRWKALSRNRAFRTSWRKPTGVERQARHR